MTDATPCVWPMPAWTLDGPDCGNPNHDHEGYDVNGDPTGEPMRCGDCGALTHYDMGSETYEHDSADTPPCFLIQR